MLKVATSLILVLLLITSFTALQQAPAAWAEETLSLTTRLAHVEDECGRLRNNPDGTFYSGDAFKIAYAVGLGPDIVFTHLEVTYDVWILDASGSTGMSGEWLFQVSREVEAGSYEIAFTAYGIRTYTYVEGNETMIAYTDVEVSSVQTVTVVPYDPQFTVMLTYPLFKDSGWNSYEKPFVALVQYNGNGASGSTAQRAIVDSYSYAVTGMKSVLDPERCLNSNLSDCSDLLRKEFPDARVYWWNGTECGVEFEGDRRYARLVLNMTTEDSLENILQDGYSTVSVNITFFSTRFSLQPQPLFEAAYTYLPAGFRQPLLVEAYRPVNEGWIQDPEAQITLTVKPTGDTTYGDYLLASASDRLDNEASDIFRGDLYSMGNQVFKANGSLSALVNKTSLSTYAATLIVEGYGRVYRVNVTNIFAFSSEPVELYVNMVGGGLNITRVYEGSTYISLDLDIAKEAGGVKQITVYDPDGSLIKNYILPDAASNSILGSTGWFGPYFITIPLSSSTGSLLTVKYENIWGASSEIQVPVSPYQESSIMISPEFAYLLGLLIIALILAAVIRSAVRGN